jgi:hypothetical protein
MAWYPPWYLVALNLPPMAPTNQKSLPYPIYSVRTNSTPMLGCLIQANGERNDLTIINLFSFTLKDALSEWGENSLQFHPRCTFDELKTTFFNHYWKVWTNKQVYGFESHQTNSRQKGGSILWTYTKIGKLLKPLGRQQFAYDIFLS